MSLLGVDHALVGRCPAPERGGIVLLEGIALFNCFTAAFALGMCLIRLGESPYVAAVAGAFAGRWFACIQLLIVMSRGGGRSIIRSPLSALCCFIFLSGIAVAVSSGLTFGMGLPSHRWFDGLTPLVLSSFLIPWITARRVFRSGVYYRLRQEDEAECLNRWNLTFIPRYEALVRSKLKKESYRIPPEMVRNGEGTFVE